MNNDLYMYSNGYRFSVGSIKKINEKTYTMSCGYKLRKDTFDKEAYKLTDEEALIYKGELIKNLAQGVQSLKNFKYDLSLLNRSLNESPLVQVNTKALQETVDNLNIMLQELVPNTFVIDNKEFTFHKFVPDLVEEVEKDG